MGGSHVGLLQWRPNGVLTPMRVQLSGQVSLPTNPNCVAFGAEAADVLAGRSWPDVQKLALRAQDSFIEASGLSALSGFSWRHQLDRRNRRHTRLVMFFVFDGPATSDHLDVLEGAAEASPVAWSQASIERVPANAVLSLLRTPDGVLQLWTRAQGELVARKLVLREGKVVTARQPISDADPADFMERAEHAEAIPAAFSSKDRELERMRMVLALHFSQRIIEADEVVRPSELEFMEAVFPPEVLERVGLADEATRAEYLKAAHEQLPGLLGHHDKLALIGLFFSACYSDGSLDAREMRVLREAGEVLGLSRQQVVKYLQRLW